MTKAEELRERADAMEASLSPGASPSSEEWVSPERYTYVMAEANKLRQQAADLEAKGAQNESGQ